MADIGFGAFGFGGGNGHDSHAGEAEKGEQQCRGDAGQVAGDGNGAQHDEVDDLNKRKPVLQRPEALDAQDVGLGQGRTSTAPTAIGSMCIHAASGF